MPCRTPGFTPRRWAALATISLAATVASGVAPAATAQAATGPASPGSPLPLTTVTGARRADPLRPVAVEGGWALPGRYVVVFDAPPASGTLRAALDPTDPLTYWYAAPGVYEAVYPDRDLAAMQARRATLVTRPGVRAVHWAWFLTPGQPVDPVVPPTVVDLTGSGYDPQTATGIEPVLGPSPEQLARRTAPASRRDAATTTTRAPRTATGRGTGPARFPAAPPRSGSEPNPAPGALTLGGVTVIGILGTGAGAAYWLARRRRHRGVRGGRV